MGILLMDEILHHLGALNCNVSQSPVRIKWPPTLDWYEQPNQKQPVQAQVVFLLIAPLQHWLPNLSFGIDSLAVLSGFGPLFDLLMGCR